MSKIFPHTWPKLCLSNGWPSWRIPSLSSQKWKPSTRASMLASHQSSRGMAMGRLSWTMETFTRDHSKTTRGMGLGSASSVLEPSTKVIGRMTSPMATASFSRAIMSWSRQSSTRAISMHQGLLSSRWVQVRSGCFSVMAPTIKVST